MNPTILGVIGPGFLNQVPTLHNNETRVGGGLHDNTASHRVSGKSIPNFMTWALVLHLSS